MHGHMTQLFNGCSYAGELRAWWQAAHSQPVGNLGLRSASCQEAEQKSIWNAINFHYIGLASFVKGYGPTGSMADLDNRHTFE
eukprot:scaffold219344_cov18-Tisochrysis_lutea.AAC.1